MIENRFVTVVNCIDGRVQLPVINYMTEKFGAKYVDSITEPGPVQFLTGRNICNITEEIISKIQLTYDRHDSRILAIVIHHDCAGNPLDKEAQLEQLELAISYLRARLAHFEITGLWVDSDWQVHKIH